jgi:hypothetical protein
MYMDQHQQDWDCFLGLVTHAYNSAVHATTLQAPYFLMFGRQPPASVPQLHRLAASVDASDLHSHYSRSVVTTLSEAHATVLKLNQQAEQDLREANARISNPHRFAVGDTVSLLVPRVKEGSTKKLARLWTGPYRVTQVVGDVNYGIVPVAGGPGQVVHAARLQLFKATPDRFHDIPVDELLDF